MMHSSGDASSGPSTPTSSGSPKPTSSGVPILTSPLSLTSPALILPRAVAIDAQPPDNKVDPAAAGGVNSFSGSSNEKSSSPSNISAVLWSVQPGHGAVGQAAVGRGRELDRDLAPGAGLRRLGEQRNELRHVVVVDVPGPLLGAVVRTRAVQDRHVLVPVEGQVTTDVFPEA